MRVMSYERPTDCRVAARALLPFVNVELRELTARTAVGRPVPRGETAAWDTRTVFPAPDPHALLELVAHEFKVSGTHVPIGRWGCRLSVLCKIVAEACAQKTDRALNVYSDVAEEVAAQFGLHQARVRRGAGGEFKMVTFAQLHHHLAPQPGAPVVVEETTGWLELELRYFHDPRAEHQTAFAAAPAENKSVGF